MFNPASLMSRLCTLPLVPPVSTCDKAEIDSSLLLPSAHPPSPPPAIQDPWQPYSLPASPPNSSQTALPGYSALAVLSWMTSADILWTYDMRSFRPRAPSPLLQSSSTRPAAAAPSCTPTGLYTCLRFASCCRGHQYTTLSGQDPSLRPMCSNAPFLRPEET